MARQRKSDTKETGFGLINTDGRYYWGHHLGVFAHDDIAEHLGHKDEYITTDDGDQNVITSTEKAIKNGVVRFVKLKDHRGRHTLDIEYLGSHPTAHENAKELIRQHGAGREIIVSRVKDAPDENGHFFPDVKGNKIDFVINALDGKQNNSKAAEFRQYQYGGVESFYLADVLISSVLTESVL